MCGSGGANGGAGTGVRRYMAETLKLLLSSVNDVKSQCGSAAVILSLQDMRTHRISANQLLKVRIRLYSSQRPEPVQTALGRCYPNGCRADLCSRSIVSKHGHRPGATLRIRVGHEHRHATATVECATVVTWPSTPLLCDEFLLN